MALGRTGLAVRIEMSQSCNMQSAMADVRKQIGPHIGGARYTLSVICLCCAAVQIEGGEGDQREEHASDCSTACSMCTVDPERAMPPRPPTVEEAARHAGLPEPRPPLFTRMTCTNCEHPIEEHCHVHQVPCCPGKCPGKVLTSISG